MASTHPFIQGLLGVVVGNVDPDEVLRYSLLQFCGSSVNFDLHRELASTSGRATRKTAAFLQKGLAFPSLKDRTAMRAFQDDHLPPMFVLMMANVVATIHYFKVFNPVVFFIPILVMHHFIGVKKPTKVILNYDPVFQSITIFVSTWVFRNQREIVISLVDDLPNLPHRTLLFEVRRSIL